MLLNGFSSRKLSNISLSTSLSVSPSLGSARVLKILLELNSAFISLTSFFPTVGGTFLSTSSFFSSFTFPPPSSSTSFLSTLDFFTSVWSSTTKGLGGTRWYLFPVSVKHASFPHSCLRSAVIFLFHWLILPGSLLRGGLKRKFLS